MLTVGNDGHVAHVSDLVHKGADLEVLLVILTVEYGEYEGSCEPHRR